MDARGRTNPDGWGIALYMNDAPVVERRSTAAFSDLRFSEVAAGARAHTVVAHVRKASVGAPAIENTHPFTCGRWTFAHNGTVSAFERVGPLLEAQVAADLLQQRHGTTDSELCFLWLLSRLRQAGMDLDSARVDLARAVARISESVVDLDALCKKEDPIVPATLNFVVTNGQVLIATRWNAPLHWQTRDGESRCDMCGTSHTTADDEPGYRALVVASERICCGDWQELPEHGLVASDEELRIQCLVL